MKERILNFVAESHRPVLLADIISHLRCDAEAPLAYLQELLSEGELCLNKKGKYCLPQSMGLFRGRIQGSDKGFGFFVPEDEHVDDLFIPPFSLNGALHKDRVLVREVQPEPVQARHRRQARPMGKRREAEVIKILEHANTRIVGTYQKAGHFGFCYPDDKNICTAVYVSKADSLDAVSGDKVIVQVKKWHNDGKNPEGVITEIFGSEGDAAIDILSIAKKYELEEEFPEKVIANAQKVAVIEEKDFEGRLDLRGEFIVTIDGIDAKDLDDAVSLERKENGNWLLGVHIADVAHFVAPNSPLDKEAWQRATSVYLPGMVIPMLPRELSNGVCSLHPGEDKLTLSCLMEISPNGKILESHICESVIHSKRRLNYDEVNRALRGEPSEYEDILPFLQEMKELRDVLFQKRLAAGSVDFDIPEIKVLTNEKNELIDIRLRRRDAAESLIEEMMIAANEAVATEYFFKQAPFLYRVHQSFSKDRLTEINQFLAMFGLEINCHGGNIKAHHIKKVLDAAKGEPYEQVVAQVLLQSMNHAFYSPDALGHFALALPYYSHFTSPIRRYPDLAIHRVIKTYLKLGFLKDETAENWYKEMAQTAHQSSKQERRAEEAEREAVSMKCAEYMAGHIGEEFDGRIAGVTGFGIFVQLENGIEGLVHISAIDNDFYEYFPTEWCLRGKDSGRVLRLGDEVRVVIHDVDRQKATIDMLLCD
ncbi:MAG: ribonuclease R [Firmicutes bacterium]|nr:ribonuclease R [Bacillota bacterium]